MKSSVIIFLILIFSLVALFVCPFIGMYQVSLNEIFNQVKGSASGRIFWQIRVPRVCLAYLAGATLAVCGMAFQAFFRNPLATPFTLGVSSGAALGATLCIRFGFVVSLLGLSSVTVFAFAGALIATFIVYGVSQLKKNLSSASLLLAGVAVNFFFSSLILFIQYSANYFDVFRVLRWSMGGLLLVGFEAPLQVLPAALLSVGLAFYLRYELNLLTTGEEIAAGRGVDVERVKRFLFFAISLSVGAVVAVCGPIGFVGLMCPHICRLFVGSDHRRLLPATALFGGAFLVVCDTAARTVIAPTDLPVGIFTSFLGGPFFLWLLLRRKKLL